VDSIALLPMGAPNLTDLPAVGERADVRGESFLSHLQRLSRDDNDKLLGAAGRRRPEPLADDDAPAEPAAAVAQFLALLRDFAADLQKPAGGDWRLADLDADQLRALAQAAGLDGERLAGLEALLAADKRQGVSLDALLGFFQRQLADMARQEPVTVPETGLPLIESILARLGIDAGAVERIGEGAVTGDDRLDLGRLLAALRDITPQLAGGPVELSAFERRELLRMFEAAGASSQLAEVLAVASDEAMSVDFERFVAMLQQGLDDIVAQRPTVDPLAFVERLQDLLAEAGFAKENPAWTPLVQKSLTVMYEKLTTMVDLSTVQVTSGDGLVAGMVDETMPLFGDTVEGGGIDEEVADSPFDLLAELATDDARQEVLDDAAGLARTGDITSQERVAAPSAVEPARHARHLEQSVLQQLRDGIVSGLSQRKHHLVLKLHPPELGEVKVDIVVRHDQVAVSFAMENSRVKEILESNMQQFRDSLEQRGFSLGQCFVSVGQDNSAGQQRWQAMMAALEEQAVRPSATVSVAADQHLAASRRWWTADGEMSISLMV